MSGSPPDLQATIPTSPVVWADTGELRTEWRAFFRRLWARTGGTQGGAVGTGTITGVVAGTGLNGGGTNASVTLNLVTPVTIGHGGTGATTAAQGLTNLGAVPAAGGTMTGPLVLPNGTLGAPSAAFGAVDGTGISRSGAALLMGITSTPVLALFATGGQFYQSLSMLNNRITQVADATAVSDALNQRIGDVRYAPGAWASLTPDPGWTSTMRTRLLNNGASAQFDGSASAALAAGGTARIGVLPPAMIPPQMVRIPAVVLASLAYGFGAIEIRTDGSVYTNWTVGSGTIASTVSVSAIYALN